MKVLVIGGTGTVGSEVVKALVKRGAHVHVLTRSPDKLKDLGDVHAVGGDLLDPVTVRSVFKGMDGVFLLNPVSTTETHEGLMGLNGARLAGIKRLVYMSVHEVDRAPHLPHFGAKLPIERVALDSGYSVLRPNNFFQNDYWYKDALLQYGVYPQPMGDVGLSRVDTRDIADAAAAILVDGGHEGKTYNLIGPEVMTGANTAEIWGRALGRTIYYGGNDLEAWEKQSLQYTPAWMVFDFRLMYEFFQKHGLKATAEDIAAQTALTGHAPRSFEAFATETAKAWQA